MTHRAQLPLEAFPANGTGGTGIADLPWQITAYGYDDQGRLTRAGTASDPMQYRFDPAGNRLPDPGYRGPQGEQTIDWHQRVRANLHDSRFDLLRPDAKPLGQATGTVTRWMDNRIAHHDGKAYDYDAHGNRIATWSDDPQDGTLRFFYDGSHQLVRVERSVRGAEDGTPTVATAVYRYDAFGRRIVKRHQPSEHAAIATLYYGWDGDRLVHTETAVDTTCTVYEPGGFVPLLSLHKTKAEKEPSLGALVLGQDGYDRQGQWQQRSIDSAMATVLAMPTQERLALFSNVPGIPAEATEALMQSMDSAYRGAKALNPPQVRHFHCDHLGTPIAMTQATGERTGQLVWAARYDAWGKVENEYNPNSIEQPIRFQGQQYDKETGLHYNRFRYYEESSGSYINQDPAGLAGGINKYKYARNIPNGLSDAYGLNPAAGAILGAEAGTLVLPGPGTVIGAVVGTLVGLAALMLASNVLQSSNQQASDRQKEYENYKRVCNESPPPGLDKCAEAAWKLKRNKSCRNLRKDWDDKWQPGRHDADIENLDRGINNLEEWISKNCHGT